MRPRLRLIAGAVTCRRAAAPVTLPSSSSASRAVSRFKSNCMRVILAVLDMHLKLMKGLYTFEVRAQDGTHRLTRPASSPLLTREYRHVRNASDHRRRRLRRRPAQPDRD